MMEKMQCGAEFIIRPGQREDREAIMDLLQENDLIVCGVSGREEYFWVACQEENLVGVIGLERGESTGLLRSLAVRTTHRNQGVADRLVEAVLGRAVSEKLKSIYLLTNTAEKYFLRKGFHKTERCRMPEELMAQDGMKDGCASCNTCMEKVLEEE